METTRKDIFSNEISIYAELDFSLFLPFEIISTHFSIIVSRTEYTDIEAYLGGCNHFYMITSDELLPRSPAPLVL
jgi:hypothetical protein